MDRRAFIAAAVGTAVAKAEPKYVSASDTVTFQITNRNQAFVIHHVVVDGWFPWNAPAAMKHALESAKQGD